MKKISVLNISEREWIKPVIGVILIFIMCIIISPVSSKGTLIFLKFENLANVLRQISEIGIISVGLTLVIIAAGIDLSVGSVLALSATVTAFGIMDWQLGFVLTILLALFVGAFVAFGELV